jgi:hypothetical protein
MPRLYYFLPYLACKSVHERDGSDFIISRKIPFICDFPYISLFRGDPVLEI